jgi:Right handed beta helix region
MGLRNVTAAMLLLVVMSAPCLAAVISSCGTVISSPGTYTFSRDVDCTSYGQSGIIVDASNTVIDCGGYALTGKGGYPSWGVRIDGASGVTIENCKVSGFFFGIGVGMAYFLASGGSGHKILNNVVSGSDWAGIYTYMVTDSTIDGNAVYPSPGSTAIYIAFQSYNTRASNNVAPDIAVIPSGDICQGFDAQNTVSGNTLSCGIYTEDSSTMISNNKVCGSSGDSTGTIFCAFSYRCGLHGSPNISVFTGNSCDSIPTSYGGCGSNAVCHQCSDSIVKPINTTVNESWITVPADPSIGTPAFAVMTYEARRVSDRPFSQSGGVPWVNISRDDASASCEDRGPEYHLVTQLEALAISRNIERTAINDLDPLNSSVLFANGSTENEGGVSADDSPVVSSCNLSVSLSDPQNALSPTCQLRASGYVGTGGSWGNQSWLLRTHVLSDGEVIWDWAGNAWEWISASCMRNNGSGCDNCYYGVTSDPMDWSNASIGSFERGVAGPSNAVFGVVNGVGSYTGCLADYDSLVRGGYNLTSAYPYVLSGDGIYALNMGLAPSDSRPYLGFRCVRNIG